MKIYIQKFPREYLRAPYLGQMEEQKKMQADIDNRSKWTTYKPNHDYCEEGTCWYGPPGFQSKGRHRVYMVSDILKPSAQCANAAYKATAGK